MMLLSLPVCLPVIVDSPGFDSAAVFVSPQIVPVKFKAFHDFKDALMPFGEIKCFSQNFFFLFFFFVFVVGMGIEGDGAVRG